MMQDQQIGAGLILMEYRGWAISTWASGEVTNVVAGPYSIAASQAFTPGSQAAMDHIPGSTSAQS